MLKGVGKEGKLYKKRARGMLIGTWTLESTRVLVFKKGNKRFQEGPQTAKVSRSSY